MWIWLVLLYGVLKGSREIVKKKSFEKNTVMEVLLMYTVLSFLIVVPTAPKAMGVEWKYMGFIALKSFVVFSAWIFGFHAIKKMPVSMYGILDLSRVIFSTLLGIVVLKETMGVFQIVGLVLVCGGLLLLKVKKKQKEGVKETTEEKVAPYIVLFAFASCLLNSVSGTMDKVLMKYVNSTQLLFWYMLFMVIFYIIYCIVMKQKIRIKECLKNYWVWILAILFVIGDKALFIANQSPDSKVTVMTLLKQAGCIVTIVGGRLVFKEKNIVHKLICASIIIIGIVLAVIK